MCISKALAQPLALTFPDTSLFIKVVRSLERKIDERLRSFPALHQIDDPVSPRIDGLLRKPFQRASYRDHGLAQRWQQVRTGVVVAKCGTGKTLISLGAIHVHSDGKSIHRYRNGAPAPRGEVGTRSAATKPSTSP